MSYLLQLLKMLGLSFTMTIEGRRRYRTHFKKGPAFSNYHTNTLSCKYMAIVVDAEAVDSRGGIESAMVASTNPTKKPSIRHSTHSQNSVVWIHPEYLKERYGIPSSVCTRALVLTLIRRMIASTLY